MELRKIVTVEEVEACRKTRSERGEENCGARYGQNRKRYTMGGKEYPRSFNILWGKKKREAQAWVTRV